MADTIPTAESALLLALDVLEVVGQCRDDPAVPCSVVRSALDECAYEWRPELATVLAVNLAALAERFRMAAEAAGVDVEAIQTDVWLQC